MQTPSLKFIAQSVKTGSFTVYIDLIRFNPFNSALRTITYKSHGEFLEFCGATFERIAMLQCTKPALTQ